MPCGKKAPNGLPEWGSTISDFYVNHILAVPNYCMVTSGCRLAAWAREVGELDWAVDELAQADQCPHMILQYKSQIMNGKLSVYSFILMASHSSLLSIPALLGLVQVLPNKAMTLKNVTPAQFRWRTNGTPALSPE